MPLFIRGSRKILLLHIPKTGGTSLRKWLQQPPTQVALYSPLPPAALKVTPQHLQVSDIAALLGDMAWDWAFAVVRNPYARAESEFHYRMASRQKKGLALAEFSPWLLDNLAALQANPFHLDNHFRPQHEFVDAAVQIFRFEDGLMAAAAAAAAHLGLEPPLALPTENASPEREVVWTADVRERFNAVYAQDFARFGYPLLSPD